MLSKLSVENYALIHRLEIDFSNGFNVITGETGAGKSILVGAISLLFGSRADNGVLSDNSKKCIVEGTFQIADLPLISLFEANDLDHDSTLIIRREINPQGKSRAFINDTPVTLNVLKAFADRLIDIHSQHHSLLLNETNFQLNLVDQFAKNQSLRDKYDLIYHTYIISKKQLEALQLEEKKASTDKDYFQFLFDEISEVNPQLNEEVTLEEELNVLTHAETIQTVMHQTNGLLTEHDFAIVTQLSEIKTLLNPLASIHGPSAELKERIDSCLIELKDIANEAISVADEISVDASRLDQISTRLDLLNKLLLKHRITTADELIAIGVEFDQKLNAITSLDSQIEKLTKELAILEKQLSEAAKNLSQSRKEQLKPMSDEISEVLAQLGMKNCDIVIALSQKATFGATGTDDVEILFSANKGQQPRPLDKVASGGEMSRLMLAIKSLIHTRNLIPIAIFDEIDTGVSGDVAAKVANILLHMSQSMQIIAISHLPQIAAKAESHWWVYKESDDHKTLSNIKKLNHQERIHEIAQMISGEQITDAAMAAAEKLLN
jgi:DNA repair protein RecN (Recombination protein N)